MKQQPPSAPLNGLNHKSAYGHIVKSTTCCLTLSVNESGD
jgi:hypothetical protein